MSFFEIIRLSLRNIRSNMLRVLITMAVIAFGIAALVGILTAIDTAIFAMSDSFSSLGSRSFSIIPGETGVGTVIRGEVRRQRRPISWQDAEEFKKRFDQNGTVCIAATFGNNSVVKFQEKETNPVVQLTGTDENELLVRGSQLSAGRFFNPKDIESAAQRIVVGDYIVKTLFDGQESKALNQVIWVDGFKYRIIGILAPQGSGINQNADKNMFIPISQAHRRWGTDRAYYDLTVGVNVMEELDEVMSESVGLMRKVRGLKAKEENDFEIRKSDGLIKLIKENTSKLRWGAIGIGIITLLGAAIGLMNIMLVSVTERTREIGIIKAIGATRSSIIQQFLTEAIVICQLGGVLGILLGIVAGVAVAAVLNGNFIIPWLWIGLGILLCLIVGLLSGLYPAFKASRLDPIESLRYE